MNDKTCKRLRREARAHTVGEGVDSTRIAYRALKSNARWREPSKAKPRRRIDVPAARAPLAGEYERAIEIFFGKPI